MNFLTEQSGIKGKTDLTIYDLIKQDHDSVKNMLHQMLDSAKFDADAYAQIRMTLKAHIAGEEKLLYSRLEDNKEVRALVLEAYEAHDLGKQIMIDIDMSESENFSADWLFAKVKLLNVAVNVHFSEEETALFSKAKNVFSSDDAYELGRLFQQEKNAGTL